MTLGEKFAIIEQEVKKEVSIVTETTEIPDEEYIKYISQEKTYREIAIILQYVPSYSYKKS